MPTERGLVRSNLKLSIMSKGNMLLGQARGKVGSLVFSRANGRQIVRSRAEVIKNPQTQAQMVQRIILQTVAQAYSKMQEIVNHSFEGLAPGQESMSYFMKQGLKNLRDELSAVGDFEASFPTFVPLGSNYFAVNPYPIAKGTLPEITVGDFAGGDAPIAVSGNTYQDVISSLNAQRGDQLTIVALEGTAMNAVSFRYARVILDPREEDGSQAALDTPFIVEGVVNKPNPKNEWNGAILRFDSNQLLIDVPTVMCGCTAILSRQKTDGTWLRSNATMIVSEDVAIGLNMQTCLDAFAAGGLDIISERYLNNASRSRAIVGGGSIQPVPPVPVPGVTSATVSGSSWTAGYSAPATLSANAVEVHTQNAVGKVVLLDIASSVDVVSSQKIIIGTVDQDGVAKNGSALNFQEGEWVLKIAEGSANGSAILATDTRRMSHSDI